MYAPYTLSDWQRQYDDPATTELSMYFLPNISSVIDAFAKTYYSLLLSDFNSTSAVSLTNALASADGLQYLQSMNSTETADDVLKFTSNPHYLNGTIPQIYDPQSTNLTEPLATVKHLTLDLQYLCSIPQKKSAFKLVFAVVLADLVFLNACWTLFGWTAVWWLGRKDTTTEHCIGCVQTDKSSVSLGGGGEEYSRVPDQSKDGHKFEEIALPKSR